MNAITVKPRLAVVSPFVDKRHGTERRVAEWLTRLAGTFEIHLYSQHVADLDLSRITWHRIPKLPGPHLFNYLWWLFANHLWRAWDSRFRGLRPAIVFSPGINCIDADVISVHVLFAEYLRRNRSSLLLRNQSLRNWPRTLHRRLYYALIARLERSVYANPSRTLILIARKTSSALAEFYGRTENLPVVYLGLDHEMFNPENRRRLRESARRALGLEHSQFALLLIGNDWRNKGLPVLLEALECLRDLPLVLLVAGQDDSSPYLSLLAQKSLSDRVQFLASRADVEMYYAAADVYVGPSREDTFAQPPAEAMACGLPVITSITNGTAEIMTDGENGIVLRDECDSADLASAIRRIYEDASLRERLGRNAAAAAGQFTWEQNGTEIAEILSRAILKKHSAAPTGLRQEA